jgi:hypothetical protein
MGFLSRVFGSKKNDTLSGRSKTLAVTWSWTLRAAGHVGFVGRMEGFK